ncbi:AMP-binding protein [Amycolatopsis sp. cmx-4-83]|uniref:AMP-binding protein n=1 Tax=Amycolatopsis sp. cmx-4-83 TaxID=2790940 RepID=UPI00397D287F
MNTVTLTPAQRDIWAAQRLGPQVAHHLCRVLDLTGAGTPAALQGAVDRLVATWSALRLGVTDQGGQPHPFVRSEASVVVHVDRLPTDGDLPATVAAAMAEPFDLGEPPLLRVWLLEGQRDGRSASILVVVAHHLAVDGVGFNHLVSCLVRDWACHQQGVNAVAVPPQVAIEHSTDIDVAYWTSEFGGALEQSLPDRDCRTPPGGRLYRRDVVNGDLDAQVRTWARQHGHSHASVLLTIFSAALHRWCDTDDVIITSQASLRRRRDAKISMATTTVPLRSRLHDEDAPRFVRRTRERFVAALRHRDEPFADVLGVLRPTRRTDGTSVFSDYEFNHMVAWRPPVELKKVGWQVTDVPVPDPATQYAVTLSVVDGGNHTVLRWHADGRRLDQVDLDSVAAVFTELLGAIVKGNADTAPLAALQVVDQAQHDALHRLGAGPVAAVSPTTVTEQFLSQPATRTAIRRGADSLTYQVLAGMAGGVQQALSEHGVAAGDRVAVHLHRGPTLVSTQLAIWGLCAVYVPIDIANPGTRILRMLDQVRPKVLITDQQLDVDVRTWLQSAGVTELAGDQPPATLVAQPAPTPRHPAYVVFTSGSTGAPKGVEIGVTAMNNHLEMMLEIGIGAGDCVAQNAPLGFDVHVWQCVAALTVGAAVRIVDDAEARDPSLLARAVAADQITILEVVPSLLDVLAALAAAGALNPTMLRPLRHLLPTGEAMPMALARRLLKLLPGVQITNAYGPAEAADDVTLHRIRGDEPQHTAPLGPAGRNVHLAVHDRWQRHRPHGYVGEIAVAGLCVGNGYVGPDTLPAFSVDPCGAGPMYRTGDVGFLDDGGVVHYLGRRDQQVKVGGRRIEMGEVEAALRTVAGVDAAAVVCVQRRGHATLVAFVATDASPLEGDLKADLAARLPAYMVPARVLVGPDLPTTDNGKLDRRTLQERAAAIVDTDTAPTDHTDLHASAVEASTVEAVWRVVLGVEGDLDRGAGFFALGGDSFTALELIARLDALGVTTDLATLYANQSLDAFERAVATPTTVLSLPVPTQGLLPSAVLQTATASATTRPPVVAFRFDPWMVDVDTLTAALNRVVAKIVALRLAIERRPDGQWHYALLDHPALVPVVEADVDEDGVLLHVAAGALNATAGVNLAAAYCQSADGRLEILLAASHVVVDVAAVPQLVHALGDALSDDSQEVQDVIAHVDAHSGFLNWLAALRDAELARKAASDAKTAAVGGNPSIYNSSSDREPPLSVTQLQVEIPASLNLDDLDAAVLTAAVLLSGQPATAVDGIWREFDGRPLVANRSGHIEVGCYTLLTPALAWTGLINHVRELSPAQALPLVRHTRVTGVDRGRLFQAVESPQGAGAVVNTLHQPIRFGAAALPAARLVPAVAAHNAVTSPHLVHVDAHLDTAGQTLTRRSATLTVTFHPATTAQFRQAWIDGLRDCVTDGLAAASPQSASAGTVAVPPGAELLNLSPASLEDLVEELENRTP